MTGRDICKILDEKNGEKMMLEKQISSLQTKLDFCVKDSEFIEQAQVLLQTTAQETQNQLRFTLEDIVNTGLETCFPGTYSIHIDFINKRGKVEADIYLQDQLENRVDPLTDNGGGLADIVSFSLRMASWALGKTDNVIILDEPFKFLSVGLRPLAGELLKTLSEKLNLQIIMVTHDPELTDQADKIFTVSNENGKARIL